MQKQMPRIGSECTTADGVGVVLENNVITETTKVKVTLADGTLDVRSYPFRDLILKSNGCNCADCEAKCKDEDRDDTDADAESGDEIHSTDQNA